MKIHLVLAGLILLAACKKHSSGTGGNSQTTANVPLYFKDIQINEVIEGNTAPFQSAIGYFPLKSDPNTQIMVASRGAQEVNGAKGFRVASISKTHGTVNWVKSYDLPDSFEIQFVTAATIDAGDNIWIAGHSFAGTGVAGILFLAKLDASGNILWSGSLSNYQGWRTYSLLALHNGDIALFAKGFGAMAVLRLNAGQQLVWSTIIAYSSATIDNDFYANGNTTLSPENHAMVEAVDGSIYVASSSNPGGSQPGSDRLYKLDAGGNLQYSKTYTVPGGGAVRPVQLTNVGTDDILMSDQEFMPGGNFSFPYFILLSGDGSVVTSRGEPFNQGASGAVQINEVIGYHGNICYSTCGDYQFNTYMLDGNLNLKSSIETIAALDIGTDRGGIALFDSADNALYYLCNFGGNFGESNGFEITRNGPDGKPCITTYTNPPDALTLQNLQATVAADAGNPTIIAGPAPVFVSLPWRTYTVVLENQEVVCGQ